MAILEAECARTQIELDRTWQTGDTSADVSNLAPNIVTVGLQFAPRFVGDEARCRASGRRC